MDIFRLAKPEDINDILAVTKYAGSGLTNVPKTKARLKAQLEESHAYMQGDSAANRILFVVEREGVIAGISGIIPKLGVERPFYNFKRSRHSRRSKALDAEITYETLQLTTDFDGYSEVATLFMSPKARGGGLGKLLSYGRFAYIAQHPDAFSDRIMAEIRGWFDEADRSPFWEHLASKFISTEFNIADKLSVKDGQFIVDLLPHIPILMNLLPEDVSGCVGRPHDLSAPALAMLERIGFHKTDLVDVFDGGPAIECRRDQTVIARSHIAVNLDMKARLKHLSQALIFSGHSYDFKATLGNVDFGKAALSEDDRSSAVAIRSGDGLSAAKMRDGLN